MKKILAVLIALMMITACAAEDNSGMQSSTADGSGSSVSGYSEENREASAESSSQTSHSSQQSGDPVPGGTESGSESSGSSPYSETSSAPGIISGGSLEPAVPGGDIPAGGIVETGSAYVKRANARVNDGEALIWAYAENEKASENDKPFVVFTSAKTLENFVSAIEGIYQIGEGGGSLKEQFLSYDESFFAENVLLLTHIRSNSGSVRYEIKGIFVNGTECSMAINASMPEVGTADMADWFIFAECPKNAVENCESYKVNLGI